MEETLTDCLVRVREDLSQLKKVRDYLDTNVDTDERCYITWRTIEAFNSILSVCSSQNSPETNALDILLDSFYYLARNNVDDSVWDDFGFELGIICVKVLSAIERCDIFEILFCKLLSVISIISEHNSNVWKAAARQILNVLINKKFSISYLEPILKMYICILKNIDGSALREFSSQNLHLLRTLSLLVQKVGDFEIQSNVVELIFLHLLKETKLMSDFFSATEKNLFQSLQFADFEHDCRLYLNGVNKPRRGVERKVYSISCHVLYLGGCSVDPPPGENSVWVDANKDTERVSIKCRDDNGSRVILIRFSEILNVQLEIHKTQGKCSLKIQTKSLMGLHKEARNDDICLVTNNSGEFFEFADFLQAVTTGKRKKRGSRESRTVDCLIIDRPRVQDDAITSSVRIDHNLPDVLTQFENKMAEKSPRTVVPETQELSPNSFAESLNKHIESQELRHTYEDSIETIKFLQTPRSHRLFRSPHEIFNLREEKPEFDFTIFGGNKENEPPCFEPATVKTYSRKSRKVERAPQVPKERKHLEVKLSNTQSQDCFRASVFLTKKPCLPKLKRSKKEIKRDKEITRATSVNNSKTPTGNRKTRNQSDNKSKQKKENSKEQLNCVQSKQQTSKTRKNESKVELKEVRLKGKNPVEEPLNRQKKQTKRESKKDPNVREKNKTTTVQQDVKPSLLDPNGYTYQRWCKPTTSERSNFWLKKLNATTKSKVDPDSVFDFSEDSESWTRKKKRVVPSRYKKRQTSLREVKEMLKKSSPVKKKGSLRRQPNNSSILLPQSPEFIEGQPVSRNEAAAGVYSEHEFVSDDDKPKTKKQERSDEHKSKTKKRERSDEHKLKTKKQERSDEHKLKTKKQERSDEHKLKTKKQERSDEHKSKTKKRERSDEDSSTVRRQVKKKPTWMPPKHVIASLRRRLRKVEERDKQQTDEIIRAVQKAVNQLFNHLQRKDGQRVVSYLKTAEATCEAFGAEIDELGIRTKRIQRAILYYKAGCSVSNFCESLDGQMSKVRDALKDFRAKKDTSQTIYRVNARLADLIKSEIERTIANEWALKRSKLFRCATILGINLTEFQ